MSVASLSLAPEATHRAVVRPAPRCAPPYDDEIGPRPLLRLVTTPLPEPAPFDLDAWVSADRTPSRDLPPARPVVAALAQALVEVIAGLRSVTQLRRDTTPELYGDLVESIDTLRRPGPRRPVSKAVRSLHVQQRPEGVVEACVSVVAGQGRVRALALRLEGHDGRWRCTALDGLQSWR
jgi:hypothetical protein